MKNYRGFQGYSPLSLLPSLSTIVNTYIETIGPEFFEVLIFQRFYDDMPTALFLQYIYKYYTGFHIRVLLVHKFIYIHNTVRYCHTTICDMIIWWYYNSLFII